MIQRMSAGLNLLPRLCEFKEYSAVDLSMTGAYGNTGNVLTTC